MKCWEATKCWQRPHIPQQQLKPNKFWRQEFCVEYRLWQCLFRIPHLRQYHSALDSETINALIYICTFFQVAGNSISITKASTRFNKEKRLITILLLQEIMVVLL